MQEMLGIWVQILGREDPLEKEMYFCLENSMDRGSWQATAYGITKSRTRLSDFTFTIVDLRLKAVVVVLDLH